MNSATRRSAEVVVIGSGPGGAVTATMCAEAGKSVLLIEEGRNLPLESAPHFSREEILQKYRNAGINIGLGKTKLAYVEGRCVGGGSEINRGLYHRTARYGARKLAGATSTSQICRHGSLVPPFRGMRADRTGRTTCPGRPRRSPPACTTAPRPRLELDRGAAPATSMPARHRARRAASSR